MVIWSSQSVGKQHSCPPAHAPIFELQHYPCWFSVHLILLFRIWGTCMHPSLPYLCQTLRPTSTTSSIYPSSCWLHRYFCTEKSRVHEILVKSWLKNHFAGNPHISSSFDAGNPHVSPWFLVGTCRNYAVTW